jgi:hypothetical protein
MLRRISLLSLIVMVGLVVGAPSLLAQPAAAGGPTVNMVVTVESRHGMNPSPVDAADVLVYQDKTRDKVVSWVPGQSEHAQLELFILLDDSSGISLATQLDDIRQFINAQAETTKVGVGYMQNGTAQIVQNLTADHAQAAKALRLPLGVASINGSPYFSLSDLVKRWPAGSPRHEVLMVSDGIDRYYESADTQDPYLDSAIEDAQKAGIVVYAIYNPGVGHVGHSYWRNYWGQIYLSRLADETGGESYQVGFQGPAVAFAPYLDDVNHRFKNQYLLSFIPKPEKKSGMQRVKLTSEVPNIDLVSQDRVYVPANP